MSLKNETTKILDFDRQRKLHPLKICTHTVYHHELHPYIKPKVAQQISIVQEWSLNQAYRPYHK